MSKAKKSKRFRYPLQTVLKVREIREKQALEAFQQAEQAYHDAIKKRDEMIQFRDEQYQALRDRMSGKTHTTDVQEVILRQHHLTILEAQLKEQEERVEAARQAMETAREALVASMIDRKIIDKDKEKTRESWRKLMDKSEGQFLDDIAIIGFDAKKRRQLSDQATHLPPPNPTEPERDLL